MPIKIQVMTMKSTKYSPEAEVEEIIRKVSSRDLYRIDPSLIQISQNKGTITMILLLNDVFVAVAVATWLINVKSQEVKHV